jgi:hypothetical protein
MHNQGLGDEQGSRMIIALLQPEHDLGAEVVI